MIHRCITALALVGMMGCVPPGGRSGDDDDRPDDPGDGAMTDVMPADGGERPDGASIDGGPPSDDGPSSDGGPPPDRGPVGDARPPPDGGPVADTLPPPDGAPGPVPERCNGIDDDLDNAVDEGAVCPPPPPIPIGAPGETIAFIGALDDGSPTWQRLDEDCGNRAGANYRYAMFRIVNDSREPRGVELIAEWGDVDGFLHVFSDPFDPADDAGCLAGSDDYEGTGRSRIARQPIDAGAILTLVATTFQPNTLLPRLTIEVRTVPETELVCGDTLDDDQDGAVDCDDPDCAADPLCDACFGVRCAPGAGCADGACRDFATPLGPVGESIRLEGWLGADGPVYDRVANSCARTGETVNYATWPIVNRTGAARMIQIDGRWPDDNGFVAVFGYPFDPDVPINCLGADWGFGDAGRRAARIERLRIEPDEVLVVVPSDDRGDEPLGRFEVEVTTVADDPNVETACQDRVDDDRDGSLGCGDWDCVAWDRCRLCDDVVCAGDSHCIDGVCQPAGGAEPVQVEYPGETVIIGGVLDGDDPVWARPTAACAPRDPGDYAYDAIRLVTPPGFPMTISLTAEWADGDGFLHVFEAPFDPANLDGCIAGNDDDGTRDRSRIDDIRLERDGSVVVVVSPYDAGGTIPRYTLWVTSEPD